MNRIIYHAPDLVVSAILLAIALCLLGMAGCQSRTDRAVAVYTHDVAMNAAHRQIVADKATIAEVQVINAQEKLRLLAVLVILLSAGALTVSFEIPTIAPIAKKLAIVGAGVGIAAFALVPVIGHEGLILAVLCLTAAIILAVHHHIWTHFRSVHQLATEIATHVKADYSIISADARKEFDRILTSLHRIKAGAAKPVNLPATPVPAKP